MVNVAQIYFAIREMLNLYSEVKSKTLYRILTE